MLHDIIWPLAAGLTALELRRVPGTPEYRRWTLLFCAVGAGLSIFASVLGWL